MKLVEVYNSFSSADANLVCSALQSAGIDAQVTNELSSLSLDGYALASGGIRVMVPEDKFAEARGLIEETQLPPPETDTQ
ncbi:MAG: putative signal transducing protein [Limisphaerales bacterium]